MSITGGKTIKNFNIWRLNNKLLNNQQITEEIKKEIKICIEMNENENTTTQNLWDTVKVTLKERFIAIQAYLKKQEKSQINNLTLHLKQLEKEEMKNPRVSSVQFIRSVVSNSLRLHEPQYSRHPCPSPTPTVHPNPCPLYQSCHPTISSSVVPFSSCPQSFPSSGSFKMSQLSASSVQSIGVSASTSVPPMNTQE